MGAKDKFFCHDDEEAAGEILLCRGNSKIIKIIKLNKVLCSGGINPY